MSKQPLAEVFGYPINNHGKQAVLGREQHLCPFNNRVIQCTKDKKKNPLGVCSILADKDDAVITCPVRFRENWMIERDAADFFFPPGAKFRRFTEVRLKDKSGKTAGNFDIVLTSFDDDGRVIDFGALEVQAVYISGNIRNPFEYYMKDQLNHATMDWSTQPEYPRPDYLSSSRKRLAPQLLFKGGILKTWKKKLAVALSSSFFETLPSLSAVNREEAEIAWFIYDLAWNSSGNVRTLRRVKTVYTRFDDSLAKIVTPVPGEISTFIENLQKKLNEKLGDETR